MNPRAVALVALAIGVAAAGAANRKKSAPPKPPTPAPPPKPKPPVALRPGSRYMVLLVVIDDDPQTVIDGLEHVGFSDVDVTRDATRPKVWKAIATYDPPLGTPMFGNTIGRMTVLDLAGPL